MEAGEESLDILSPAITSSYLHRARQSITLARDRLQDEQPTVIYFQIRTTVWAFNEYRKMMSGRTSWLSRIFRTPPCDAEIKQLNQNIRRIQRYCRKEFNDSQVVDRISLDGIFSAMLLVIGDFENLANALVTHRQHSGESIQTQRLKRQLDLSHLGAVSLNLIHYGDDSTQP
ncbi:hypothetical protein ETB97_002909 [Aspergillus alliaceus]|uniref:Uncharacterized protein n=1 Tax=Petromyces alliaceus TaxID=209559 RepID=A0A8H6A0S9_PETAA|nr:hypothetical protein ETB97_002909 [Aspergillus burnettii]